MITKVLSVGGSIIAPDKPDIQFLAEFSSMIARWLSENTSARLVLVAGGGGPARTWQNARRDIWCALPASMRDIMAFSSQTAQDDACDKIGIAATRLNGELLKSLFGALCRQDVISDPTHEVEFTGRVLVAAGWKPGFSTDTDAVILAERFGADCVVNLSNIDKVYTDDPKVNPAAKPIERISWSEFRKIVGDEWTPGKNCPFDPVASAKAQELSLTVICANGKNIANTKAILNGEDYDGTTIY